MDLFNYGIPVGRYFGINVRLHFTFLIFAFYRIQRYHDLLYGLAFIGGLYVCILLHEFGHALAARWADGEAEDILLWPLGGLASCRPAWHPTAHLICTVAGPFVTLLLFVGSWMAAPLSLLLGMDGAARFFFNMAALNLWLLIFNLIPAFPMDGGRILRDTLWHWMSAEKATAIAIWVSRIIALLVVALVFVPAEFWVQASEVNLPRWVLGLGLYCSGHYWLLLLAGFALFETQHEQGIVGAEAMGAHGFSLRERLKRGARQRSFRQGVAAHQAAEEAAAFHRCTVCGRTEHDDPRLEFRVCTDCRGGQEYCRDHLDTHPHV